MKNRSLVLTVVIGLALSIGGVLAAVSVVIALTNLSILSRRSVVRGMAPAALSWSGGMSARRAGAKVNAAIMQKSVKNEERLRFIVRVRLDVWTE